MKNKNIIIYSTLLEKAFLYPDYIPFVQMYNPTVMNDRYKDCIENFLKMEEKLGEYLEVLEKELKMEIDIKNTNSSYLKTLSEKITKYGSLKASKKIYIPLFVYLGEKIRQQVNGFWDLEMVNIGLVSQHRPVIRNNKGEKYHIGF